MHGVRLVEMTAEMFQPHMTACLADFGSESSKTVDVFDCCGFSYFQPQATGEAWTFADLIQQFDVVLLSAD